MFAANMKTLLKDESFLLRRQQDINNMRFKNEGMSSWLLRKAFLEEYWDSHHTEELKTLSSAFANVVMFGCEYSTSIMIKIYEMAVPVAMAMEKSKGGDPKTIKSSWLHDRLQRKISTLQIGNIRRTKEKSIIVYQNSDEDEEEDNVNDIHRREQYEVINKRIPTVMKSKTDLGSPLSSELIDNTLGKKYSDDVSESQKSVKAPMISPYTGPRLLMSDIKSSEVIVCLPPNDVQTNTVKLQLKQTSKKTTQSNLPKQEISTTSMTVADRDDLHYYLDQSKDTHRKNDAQKRQSRPKSVGGSAGYRSTTEYTNLVRKVRMKSDLNRNRKIDELQLAKRQLENMQSHLKPHRKMEELQQAKRQLESLKSFQQKTDDSKDQQKYESKVSSKVMEIEKVKAVVAKVKAKQVTKANYQDTKYERDGNRNMPFMKKEGRQLDNKSPDVDKENKTEESFKLKRDTRTTNLYDPNPKSKACRNHLKAEIGSTQENTATGYSVKPPWNYSLPKKCLAFVPTQVFRAQKSKQAPSVTRAS